MAMRARAKLSAKSQTVIPKLVRDRLGVGPGDMVEFELIDDRVVVRGAAAGSIGHALPTGDKGAAPHAIVEYFLVEVVGGPDRHLAASVERVPPCSFAPCTCSWRGANYPLCMLIAWGPAPIHASR